MKTCPACGKSFPATLEYFHSSKNRDDGLYPYCKACARAKKREDYQRHKEKRLADLRTYYQNNADYVRARKRTYDAENRELVNERERLRRQVNADEINARQRELRSTPEAKERKAAQDKRYYEVAKHKIRAKQRAWIANKPHKNKAIQARYCARKEELPSTFTAEDWQRLLKDFQHRCAVCDSASPLTADHWIPVSSSDCPGTVPGNIIPLCQSCNSSKSNNHPKEWLINRYGDHGKRLYALIAHYLSEV